IWSPVFPANCSGGATPGLPARDRTAVSSSLHLARVAVVSFSGIDADIAFPSIQLQLQEL
ncbi:MAG: hypothetical protein ABIV63_21165, partial [Caldimonas sp.]